MSSRNNLMIFEVDKNGNYVNPQEVIEYERARIISLKAELRELRRRKYYNKTHGNIKK